jgi:hypothetical protein
MTEKAIKRQMVAARSTTDGSVGASEASRMCRAGRAVALEVRCASWIGGATEGTWLGGGGGARREEKAAR